MPSPIDATARKFLRAAKQRLTAAHLLQRADMSLDATYLAGYAVECACKALLIQRTPQPKREDLFARFFRGQRGHDLNQLAATLQSIGCHMPRDVAVSFMKTTWSTDLRYEVGLMEAKDAESFLEATETIVKWVERSL